RRKSVTRGAGRAHATGARTGRVTVTSAGRTARGPSLQPSRTARGVLAAVPRAAVPSCAVRVTIGGGGRLSAR
ncbi:hypothetical protein NGM37_57160, partial [Streptomyces sp. TRM76130]|nr:hypothetical protein [Streptomyces sp. TRM76130]